MNQWMLGAVGGWCLEEVISLPSATRSPGAICNSPLPAG